MTRITNFGVQKGYNEAQFNSHFEQPQESNDAPPTKEKKKKKKKLKKVEVEKPTTPKKRRPYNKEDRKERAAAASEARRVRRIQGKLSNIVCFACREMGHAAKDCPSNESNNQAGRRDKNKMGICYRCGSSKHTLYKCRNPVNEANPLPFATCFVCSGTGHLASNCSKNEGRGVYPNGGSCKLCGETTHLARNCRLRLNPTPPEGVLFNGSTEVPGADEDDFMVLKRKTGQLSREDKQQERLNMLKKPISQSSRKKVVVF